MPVEYIGLIVIVVMFVLMFMRVPIAIAMAIPSLVGIYVVRGEVSMWGAIENIVWQHSNNYILTTIPLFILMGQLLFFSKISDGLFDMFRKLVGRIRGGFAVATIGSSAIFAAATGSSVATTGTLGSIASKEMLKAGYNKALSGGVISAGGTLGILIPPSTMFIVYGMITEQSIGKLLIAGIVPGVVLTLLFMLTVLIAVTVNKELASTGQPYSWKEKFVSLKSTIWIVVLFIVVVGGMYIGYFTPTESAAVGALGAAIVAILKRSLNWKNLKASLTETLKTTGFIFTIIIASYLLNYCLAVTRIPLLLENLLANTTMDRYLIFGIIVLIYILLGCLMDAMAIIVVTMPIVMPIIEGLGFDLIWFGVIIVIVVETALITPPLGMNCFVLNSVAPELKLEDIFKGAALFLIPMVILIILLAVFPEIALFLPKSMG